MGILSTVSNFFSGGETKAKDWHVLTEKAQVEAVMDASGQKPQLVYKHSHTCSICWWAKKQIEADFEILQQKAEMNFVNVLRSRTVSNAFAERLKVMHESPQVIIIYEGKAAWDASHTAIKKAAIIEVLGNVVT